MELFVLEMSQTLLTVFKILVFKNFLDIYQNKKREDKEVRSSLWKLIILVVVLVCLNNHFHLNRIVKLGLWSIELSLLQIAFICIIIYFCKKNYEVKFWKTLMFFIVYRNILFITGNIIYWGITFFCMVIGFGSDNYPSVLVLILREVLVFIILFVLNLILKKYRNIFKDKKYIISILTVIFLVMFLYIYNFIDKYILVYVVKFKNSTYKYIWSSIDSFLYQNIIPSLVVIVILLIFTIKKMKESIILEKEKAVIEEKIRAQYNYYERIKENQGRTKRLYHDLKNHLVCINNIDANENASRYSMELQKEIEKIEYIYNTKNDILDIVLKEKNDICIDNNIDFFADINFEKCNFMQMIDVCSIFSNILDNAIEACLKIKDNERKIYIRGTIVKNYFVLKSVNSKINDIKTDDNNILSSKKDKYLHGIGLKSVEYSLNKYNGEFKFKDFGNEFELDIYIPIESEVNLDYEKNSIM
ncbi:MULTISPECIES: sensor histidine kinase [unclassified Clostridioides]|uniref:sensor histidine kinase n=1 Tax=unclassified Clostridioides TaxID=2635829 RepID=UPI001D0FB08F|nr:GHKL domain-containing protein [Clostridioides sp. ES-S-0171-01]UDN54181.1 GHKL domain-containing protein [Clostridioides sp. ES-S-0054-01]